MLVIMTKKKIFQQYIIFNLLESNTFLKVLFALIPVNKDVEFKFTSERERSIFG